MPCRSCGYRGVKDTLLHMVADEVIPQVNMFRAGVMNGVLGKGDSAQVVAQQSGRLRHIVAQSR